VFGKDPDDATKDFINVSQSLEEQLADIGVYSVPIATAEDFVRSEAEMSVFYSPATSHHFDTNIL
jgi:hypothetical protein